MQKNILITGDYGFIGSHFLKLIINMGKKPVGLGRRTLIGDKKRIEEVDKDKFIDYEGDICDYKLMNNIINENEIDTIVNFAASTHVDRSIKNSEPFIRDNIVGVWNLLEIIREREDIRFIQIGTDECYGSISEGSFKETDKLNPGNPYSSSKSAADLICLSYFNTYGLDITITRSSNNYGPGQHEEKLIPRMIKLAIQGKDLEIYGKGKNIRDWLYVEDNCLGILRVMENGRKGEIYNIAGNNEMTNNQVADMIASKFGVGIKYIKDRLGHDFRYSIDSNKIRFELGWKPNTEFKDGLEKTIDYYKNLL